MAEFDLLPQQAAGIVGALAFESAGLQAIQERGTAAPKGGFGWAQWTGTRRADFYRWAADNNFDVTDDEANYGFLIVELKGNEAHALDQVKKTTTVEAATETFVKQFERPSDPDKETARAIPLARQALAAVATLPPVLPPPRQPTPPTIEVMPPHRQPPMMMPPSFNAQSAGAAGGIAAMIVITVVWVASLRGQAVPETVQVIWTAGLTYLLTWFVHTRLAAALKLDTRP